MKYKYIVCVLLACFCFFESCRIGAIVQLIELADQFVLPQFQSAFRKKISIISDLSTVIDAITYSIDRSRITVLIFLEMTKDFDSMNFVVFLLQLQSFGVSVISLRSYLYCHIQFTTVSSSIDSLMSSVRFVCSVIPQGSVLRPLF